MILTRQSSPNHQLVQRYGQGGFRVSSVDFKGSIIVTSRATIAWPVISMDQIACGDFQTLIGETAAVDVCLLGCGERMMPLARELRLALKAAGLAVDPMDTGSLPHLQRAHGRGAGGGGGTHCHLTV